MRKGTLWLFVGFVTVGFLMVGGQLPRLTLSSAAAQTTTTVLKIQASFPAASLLFANLQNFAERVEKMSGGRLKVEALPAGAIVGPFEVADATNRGLLHGAHTCTYYYIGKHMAASLSTDVPGGPFGMSTIDFWGWEYEGGGIELLNEFYQQVLNMQIVAFPVFPTTAQALGWFKKPLKSVQDLKGLRSAGQARCQPGEDSQRHPHCPPEGLGHDCGTGGQQRSLLQKGAGIPAGLCGTRGAVPAFHGPL
jgi:TRAP-type mannitol/chloroaromatic compound transport system substrate-binding protein